MLTENLSSFPVKFSYAVAGMNSVDCNMKMS
jgi:hypothetical protein